MSQITKKFKEDYILLVEAGFIAVNQADEESSLALFRAAKLLDPANSLADVGMGYLHLHKLELKQAIREFEGVVEKEPNNQMARALLGICVSMTPGATTKGEQILHEAGKSKDPMIKELVHTAENFVDTFIKKTPGPAGKAPL